MRWRRIACAGALLAVLFAAPWFFFFRPLPFNREVWMKEDSRRQRMLTAYVQQHGIIGRSLQELEAELGPTSNGNRYDRGQFVTWWVGPEWWVMSIDSNYLVVELDEESKAAGWIVIDDDWDRGDDWIAANMNR